MTIQELRQHVARFSPDGPHTEALQQALKGRFNRRAVWYQTQKEHWTGWLRHYDGPGHYGRQRWDRDAQFVYNHLQSAPMLLWLAEAAGVASEKVMEANNAVLSAGPKLSSQAGALRRVMPWSLVEAGLNANQTSTTSAVSSTSRKETTKKEGSMNVIKCGRITLGTEAEFQLASEDIINLTGGSSLGGAMSMLWGFLCDGPIRHPRADHAEQVAREAAEFKTLFGADLSPHAKLLLDRLASLTKTVPR